MWPGLSFGKTFGQHKVQKSSWFDWTPSLHPFQNDLPPNTNYTTSEHNVYVYYLCTLHHQVLVIRKNKIRQRKSISLFFSFVQESRIFYCHVTLQTKTKLNEVAIDLDLLPNPSYQQQVYPVYVQSLPYLKTQSLNASQTHTGTNKDAALLFVIVV